MRNPINFKSILVQSICLAGTVILATSCSENRRMDSKDVAEQENADRLAADNQAIAVIDNNDGTKFLMEVAEMQLEEINLGKLAQQKGVSSDVKELGKMMESGHSNFLTEVTALAQSKSVSIPTTPTEDSMDAYEKLEGKSGNDFDKAYNDLMVEHHEDAIELFEKASTDSEDPQIKTWATEKLPGLRTHLEQAKSCKEKSDKMT